MNNPIFELAQILASDLEIASMDVDYNPLSNDAVYISRSMDLVRMRDTFEIVVEVSLADTISRLDPFKPDFGHELLEINEYMRACAEYSARDLFSLNPKEVLVNTRFGSNNRLVSTIHIKTQY